MKSIDFWNWAVRLELLAPCILMPRVSTLCSLHTLLPRETFLFQLNTFHCFRLCIGFKTSFQISPFSHRLFSINRSDFMKIQLLLKDKGHTGKAPGRLGGPTYSRSLLHNEGLNVSPSPKPPKNRKSPQP